MPHGGFRRLHPPYGPRTNSSPCTSLLALPHSIEYHRRMYEFFEHTADLGIRAKAPDLNALFADAATGLFAAIVEDLPAVRPASESEIEIRGGELDYLLFDWLKELLYRFDAEHMLFSRFAVKVGETGLTAKAWGEPIDPSRHVLSHEVKAITYHELRVEREGEEWVTEVIVDI
jgi:SHS2 domain-containing protein